MLTTEKNYLRDAAVKVWKDLEQAKSTFSTCREDGITDDFINRLKVRCPGHVVVDKYTLYEESGNGSRGGATPPNASKVALSDKPTDQDEETWNAPLRAIGSP